MEKNTSFMVVLFSVLFLLVGSIGGVMIGGAMVEPKVVTQTVPEVHNVTVEKVVEVQAPSVLDKAVADFMQAVEDEEDEAGNDVDVLGSYNIDEVEVSKIYDEYAVSYDGDKTTIDFKIKLRFDQEDEPSEKNTYEVTVYYEDGEDTEIEYDEL